MTPELTTKAIPDPKLITARAARLAELLTQLGRPDATILPVTKSLPIEIAIAARDAGFAAVGENRADEVVAKATEWQRRHDDGQVGAAPDWHFIGQIQSNKVAALAPHIAVWQSVDRLKIGRRIATHQPGGVVFIQMRPAALGGDTNKGGCPPADVPALADQLRGLGLAVDGIMTVGVIGDDVATAEAFADAVALADGLDLEQRSFGMSADLALAAAAGTTMVRIGTALVGARPTTDGA